MTIKDTNMNHGEWVLVQVAYIKDVHQFVTITMTAKEISPNDYQGH